jgi:hypothetical protein
VRIVAAANDGSADGLAIDDLFGKGTAVVEKVAAERERRDELIGANARAATLRTYDGVIETLDEIRKAGTLLV